MGKCRLVEYRLVVSKSKSMKGWWAEYFYEGKCVYLGFSASKKEALEMIEEHKRGSK